MNNNYDEKLKEILEIFRELKEENKIYLSSILLNHLSNGLINDGNYLNSDEAYENDKLVLEPFYIDLFNADILATALLLIGAKRQNIILNPNGIDIEPYINKESKNELQTILSKFYKLDFKNKLYFLANMIYEISIIKDVEENIDINFNILISGILDFINQEYGQTEETNLEIEITN